MTHGATAAEERPITPAEALRYAQAMCTAAGSETPRLDGEVLLRHVLGIDRTALYARMNETMSAAQAATFLTLLGRRVAGEPVAYLTGYKEFMGLGFGVGWCQARRVLKGGDRRDGAMRCDSLWSGV